MNPAARGRAGEQIAEEHLRAKGYEVLARNFRVRAGEIDIVALRDGVIVFVEVKCRASAAFAPPGAAVTARKRAHMRTAASLWLAGHDGDRLPARFDVIEVILGLPDKAPRIHHIVDAF
ncbi:MAG: YraN family protein [Oscillospiraceae bacterium]|nr:YraN family protein [Oscillospiraceae bacterium]